ncbi:MAG: CoA transferase, partial [Alphaproteobacteria bacterium]
MLPFDGIRVLDFSQGVGGRLGLGRAALKEIQPRLIHVAVSGFGQSGPDRAR